ncbi:hypothetical protein COOONC_06117 [Cooperia oncophora]
MLEDVLRSPMDPHRYIRRCVAMSRSSHPNAPSWSTSGVFVADARSCQGVGLGVSPTCSPPTIEAGKQP